MKRRRFLSFAGAAAALPALPALGAAQTATYSRASYGLAVLHARTRQHISARGIAASLRVSPAQAKAIMGELASNGIVRPVLGGAGVHVRNVSGLASTAAGGARMTHRVALNPLATANQQTALMAHLHHLCRTRGIPLSPRALAQRETWT